MIFSKNWVEKWHVHPFGRREYDFIDGLRGIAILLVIVCHVVFVNPHAGGITRILGALFRSGAIGVSLFFVLSGFLIALPFWSRLKEGNSSCIPKGYAWRRFWKIYPPLALSVLILLPVYIFWKGHPGEYFLTAVQWWTGLSFVMPVSSRINPVMWTLIVEVHFYIVLPLFFLAVKRVRFGIAVLASLGVFIVVPLIAIFMYDRAGVAFAIHPIFKIRFPTELINFSLGVLVSALVVSGKEVPSARRFGYAGLILIGFSLCTSAIQELNMLDLKWLSASMMMTLGGGGALFFVFDQSRRAGQFLCSPWLRWLGMISYEWYLLHQPLFYLLWDAKTGGNIMKYLWIVIGSGGGSLILAALMYRYFSLPILKWARGKGRG